MPMCVINYLFRHMLTRLDGDGSCFLGFFPKHSQIPSPFSILPKAPEAPCCHIYIAGLSNLLLPMAAKREGAEESKARGVQWKISETVEESIPRADPPPSRQVLHHPSPSYRCSQDEPPQLGFPQELKYGRSCLKSVLIEGLGGCSTRTLWYRGLWFGYCCLN